MILYAYLKLRINHRTKLWCDGSGSSGSTATFKSGKCVISDVWFGQDDGDLIDEAADAKNCLRKKDRL